MLLFSFHKNITQTVLFHSHSDVDFTELIMVLDIRFLCRSESKSVIITVLPAQIMSLFHWGCQCVESLLFAYLIFGNYCALT